MDAIALRPATPADSEFCYDLHRAAMGDYVEAIWGWDEPAQRALHAHAFAPGRWQIITVDGTDVGMLSVDRRPTELYLGRIEIHPDHQGRGIGSRLINELLAEAAGKGLPVVLDVLTVNGRALSLYRRLGFEEATRHGPGDLKIRMRATRRPG